MNPRGLQWERAEQAIARGLDDLAAARWAECSISDIITARKRLDLINQDLDPGAAVRRQRLAPIDNHGTRAGYVRHLNRRELPCQPCVEANRRQWQREREASRTGRKAS